MTHSSCLFKLIQIIQRDTVKTTYFHSGNVQRNTPFEDF